MKKVIFFLAITFLSTVAVAQRFEWAKGYGSEQEGCVIKGSVVDGEGNLYILGNFRIDSKWDGQRLLPMTPYGYYPDNINVLIAKISPEGEMVWKKVIHCNNGQNALSQDIKKVGDTAFACLVQYSFPSEGFNYTYYLDTLLPTWSDYPCSAQGLCWPIVNSLITFDFDGNIIEQHMLYVTYVDNDGKDVKHYMYGVDSLIVNAFLEDATFDIDRAGNVYLCRRANDVTATHYNQDGISGIKFWSDRRQVGYIDVTNEHPLRWYPQLLKFSPHLDTLLASRYVVQKSDTTKSYYVTQYLKIDEESNVFLIENMDPYGGSQDRVVYLDTLLGMKIISSTVNMEIAFLVKYDSVLTPLYHRYILDTIVGSRTIFNHFEFDQDSGLVFISGWTMSRNDEDSLAFFNGTLLKDIGSSSYVIAVDNASGEVHSYCVVPSSLRSTLRTPEFYNNLAVKNNRVFFQSNYLGKIVFPQCTVQAPQNNWGMCLSIFDYQGQIIGGYDYNTFNSRQVPYSISLQDSSLYLSGMILQDATFGDVQFSVNNTYNVFVTKLVDSSYCVPYESPQVGIVSLENDAPLSIYPNPTHDYLQMNHEEAVSDVYALSVYGNRIPLHISSNQIDVSALASGVYILELNTINHKYHLKFIKL